ncbi:MAG: hypothetical protein HC877_23480 [Thioploca sp.]|nr:hypothetical protein [Thioploca sp.]
MELLREKCFITREGVSLLGIADAAESLGFRTLAAKVSYEQLRKQAPKPCIVHWTNNHFTVVYRVTEKQVWVADPALKKTIFSKTEFIDHWSSITIDEEEVGVVLLLEPTPAFLKKKCYPKI